MSFFEATILGVVQGITEFLPISSSGHLILFRELFHLDVAGSLAFDAVLQLATVLAVIVYYWRDLVGMAKFKEQSSKRLLAALAIATVPAVLVGVFFENEIESLLRSPFVVMIALVVGAVVMYVAEVVAARRGGVVQADAGNQSFFTAARSAGVGLFQCLAFIPGFSRSGATISGALLLGFTRSQAVFFSFLLSIPILAGSGLKKLFDISGSSLADSKLLVASLVSFAVGLATIHFLVRFVQKNTFTVFIVYRIALAALLFFIL